MRWILGIVLLLGLGALFIRVFQSMSSDAVAMGLGVLFGMVASIPVALLVLAAQRSAILRERQMQPPPREPRPPREYGGTRPMVIMMPDGRQPQPPQQPWHVAQPPPPRLLTSTKQEDSEAPGNFRVIGEEGQDW